MFSKLNFFFLSSDRFLFAMFAIVLVLTLILVVVSAVFNIFGSISPVLLSKNYEQRFKAYDCGFDAFSDSRMRFDILYYLVAILFLLFDVELIFLIP